MKQLLRLRKKAKQFYPQSAAMRRQWLEKTAYLLLTGKHVAITGKYPTRQEAV